MKKSNSSTHKIYDCFFSTMEEIYHACVYRHGTNNSDIFDPIDFFLYLIKYRTDDDKKSYAPLDRSSLTKALSRGTWTDTPRISVLSDFLQLHLLNPKDATPRGEQYKKQKTTDLISYCITTLGLENPLAHLKVPVDESLVDLITICLLAGRHAFPYNNISSFLKRFPSFMSEKSSKLKPLINKSDKRFSVIYGNVNDRTAHYMTQQTALQLYPNYRITSYKSYIESKLPDEVLPWLKPTYKTTDLYPAIINAFLCHKDNHYFIIDGVPSQEYLMKLINSCHLRKNVVVICNYDIEAHKDTPDIAYIPFHNFAQRPTLDDISTFFQENNIADEDKSMAQTMLKISCDTPYILYALESLIKNLKTKENQDGFKNIIKSISLQAGANMLPKTKYSIPTGLGSDRSGRSLAGHIFKTYMNILSIDELLSITLLALHKDSGLSEKWISEFLSKDTLNTFAALIDKGFAIKTDDIYHYTDSLLIPYAFLYSGEFSVADKESLFETIFSLCQSIQDELCYRNTKPIDYSILRATIQKTFNTLFLLLSKSNDLFHAHFTEIWYFHIRCTRFLVDNGDLDTIREISNNFDDLAQKLTSRPGQENKRWKKLYDIYRSFLDLVYQSATKPSDSWNPFTNLMDKTIRFIERYPEEIFAKSDTIKILLSMIEMNLSYQLNLCIIGIRKERFDSSQTGKIKSYLTKLKSLRDKSVSLFSLKILPKDKDFLAEITVSLNDIIQIASIYIDYSNEVQGGNRTIEFRQSATFDEEPRYKQLSWFHKNCLLLTEQCISGFAKSSRDAAYRAADLQAYLTHEYNKMSYVPLRILSDYYYALLIFTLTMAPKDHGKLCSYLNKDLSRYEHIWHQSTELSALQEMMKCFTQND